MLRGKQDSLFSDSPLSRYFGGPSMTSRIVEADMPLPTAVPMQPHLTKLPRALSTIHLWLSTQSCKEYYHSFKMAGLIQHKYVLAKSILDIISNLSLQC